MKALKYFHSNEIIKVGDRIKVKKLFGFKSAVVVYVPGQSEMNSELSDDNWAIQYDNEPNDIRSLPYFPDYEECAPQKYVFVSRGSSDVGLKPEENIS